MNRLQAKIIWNHMMFYFLHEDNLIIQGYPNMKSYVQDNYDISDIDYYTFWNLYQQWVSYDMDHTGEITVYDYIYNNWNK